MQRDLLPASSVQRSNPCRLLLHFFFRIIFRRYNQRRQLHMAVHARPLNKRLYLRKTSPAVPGIILLRKSLQINIHRVNIRQNLLQHWKLCCPVRHQHGFQSLRMRQLPGVPHIFIADQRLVIGKSNPDISPRHKLLRQFYKFFRRQIFRSAVFFARHGDFIVLTKRTGKI